MAKKKLPFRLIGRDTEEGVPIYELLEQYCERYHQHLFPNRIALAWAFAWKANADGQVTLGKCKRSSDLDKEFIAYDFVILLNRHFWTDERVTDEMREALLDHELSHAEISLDKTGEPKVDERDRLIFRTRKHDIEEFTAIVTRHGVWKQDLQKFAQALLKADQFPLLEAAPAAAASSLTPEVLDRIADRVEKEAKKRGLDVKVTKGPRRITPDAKPPQKKPPTRRPRA
ncbi:MAG: putative metallopeptidase [Thermoanaerobaculia bacterium]